MRPTGRRKAQSSGPALRSLPLGQMERLKLCVVAGVAQFVQPLPDLSGLELLSAFRTNLM